MDSRNILYTLLINILRQNYGYLEQSALQHLKTYFTIQDYYICNIDLYIIQESK